jgi:hypothetical protein
VIAYSATLDVPRELVLFVAGLLRAERRRRGTRAGTRALTCFWQAVLVLRWFRDRTDAARLGRDHGVSRATAYRYLDEGIAVLAARAPDLHEALEQATADGLPYVILDGKLMEADRCTEKTVNVKGKLVDLWCSGKAQRHGGNIQAVFAPDGFPLWVSEVAPGSTHDLTVAREQVLAALYAVAKHLPTLADGGYDGAGAGVFTPVKKPDGRDLHVDNQTFNMLLRALRCLGERGFALLTQRWRTLQHITASPSRIGDITKAALALINFEHGRLAWKSLRSPQCGSPVPERRRAARFCRSAMSSVASFSVSSPGSASISLRRRVRARRRARIALRSASWWCRRIASW